MKHQVTDMNRRTVLAIVGLAAVSTSVGLQGAVASTKNFTGTWDTRANGATWQMTLVQRGKWVDGTYSNPKFGTGTISGKVKNKLLIFRWDQEIPTGSTFGRGRFALAPDGNSFTGTFESTDRNFQAAATNLQGAWTGTRLT